MKSKFIALALLVAACGPSAEDHPAGATPYTADEKALIARSAGRIESQEARAQLAAEYAVRQRLRDPGSAEFSEVAVRENGTVCGYVNSRNGYGGRSGAQQFIVAETVVLGEDVSQGRMKELWSRSCR